MGLPTSPAYPKIESDMAAKCFSAILLLFFTAGAMRQERYQYPFQDPRLSIESRVNNILSLMTLEEKIAALSTDPSVPRLGIVGSTHLAALEDGRGKGFSLFPRRSFRRLWAWAKRGIRI